MYYLVKIKFYMVVAYGNKMGKLAFMASVVIDNFCVVLFSGLHKLTMRYNLLRHFQR